MLKYRAHVYRLTPTADQAVTLGRWVGAVRYTYNLALEQRREWYRPGRRINFATQGREVTLLRAEVDWLRDVPAHPLHQALRDLDRAYQNWWSGRAGAPSPRKRGMNDSMRFPDPASFAFRRLSRNLGEVKLPKIGWVRLRWDRDLPGKAKNITVVRRAGQWFASVMCEIACADPVPVVSETTGIDRGITNFLALSDGTLIAPLNAHKNMLRRLKRAQRILARKKRGSANRRKQAARVARLHMRAANARKDFLHKITTDIAKNHGAVAIEALEVRNMVRSAKGTAEAPGKNVRTKAGLNRSIIDQGWGTFRILLSYKMAERGKVLVQVPPQNTSRECAACGVIDQASRNGERFACVACGHEAHADINAAINIKRRGDTALLPVEATRKQAGEAGTSRRIAA